MAKTLKRTLLKRTHRKVEDPTDFLNCYLACPNSSPRSSNKALNFETFCRIRTEAEIRRPVSRDREVGQKRSCDEIIAQSVLFRLV